MNNDIDIKVGAIEALNGECKDSYREAIIKACDNMKEFLLAKNAAYGNSALNPQNMLTSISVRDRLLVRMEDKLNRMVKGHEYASDDTLLDFAGYVLLLKASEILELK